MIVAKTARDLWVMGLVYLVILELMLIPTVLLFPDLYTDLRRQPKLLDKLGYAKFLSDMFSSIQDPNESVAYVNFMAVQLFFKGVNIAGLSCSVLLCTGIISRERETHTFEFLLARPISRLSILWSKFWVTGLVLSIPIFVTSYTAYYLSWAIDEQLSAWPLFICSFHACWFVLFWAAMTTWFSVWLRTQMQTAFWVGGIIILQVALFFIPTIRVASVFQFSDFATYGPVMAGNRGFIDLFMGSTIWLVGATALVFCAAAMRLRRADL